MKGRSLRIALTDRPALHVREWEGRSGPTCILLHGFGDSSCVWDEFSSSFTAATRIVAIDLRGHGESDWDPEARYDAGIHVTDVLGVMDALGIDRFVIAGHSLGGEIALRLTASCRERVIGLIMVDFGPDLNPEGVERVRADFAAGLRIYRSIAEYASWLEERRPLVPPHVLHRLASDALRLHPDGYVPKSDPGLRKSEDAPVNQASAELWRMLRQVICPTLIVRGKGSAVLSQSVAERMVSALRNGALQTVKKAGHAVMLDNAEDFANAVETFCAYLQCEKSDAVRSA
jgi:3-oxoadipate enol-lactonase